VSAGGVGAGAAGRGPGARGAGTASAPVNVGTLLSPHASTGRVAIVDLSRPETPREITHAALDARCDAVAAGLAARGLGRGDRVGILALNRPENG